MRLIDADALERAISVSHSMTDNCGIKTGYDISMKLVEDAPTIEPMQWIPCSERMPGDDEEVIVTIYDDSGDSAFSYTTVGWHFKGLWVVDNERCLKVVAWVHLPAPYKGGDADGT